jgi:S1-C subfamily serine protease
MSRVVDLVLIAAAAVAVPAVPALAQDGRPAHAPRSARRTPIVEAAERAAPAVVSISTTRLVRYRYWDWNFLAAREGQQEQHALGSGVIVHPSGFVVTNAHVINQADEVLVHLTGDREGEPEIKATLVSADLQHDLALLRLEKPGPYPYVEFGRSDDLMLGETVIAIGNPFGLGRTVTTGIVSALNRSLDVKDAKFSGLIQTDAAVNRGNSGGPLVNLLGEWIGVNSSIYSLSGGSDGISFAIPVDTVREFVLHALRSPRFDGKWLGLELGQEKGGVVVVERVWADGPAARAGIVPGTTLRGPHANDLLRACFDVLEAAPRGSVALEVAPPRGDASRVTLRFAQLPDPDRLAWDRLGMQILEIDADVSARTGFQPGAGLFVAKVRDGGAAERIQIAPGDVVTAFGDAKVTDKQSLLDALLGVGRGQGRDIRFLRPQQTRSGLRAAEWKARLVVD